MQNDNLGCQLLLLSVVGIMDIVLEHVSVVCRELVRAISSTFLNHAIDSNAARCKGEQ